MSKAKTEYMREWRAEHPEHRQYMREWREANKEKLAQYRRQWYEAHRAKEKENAVVWQKTNIIECAINRKVASANQRYRGHICSQDIRDLIERDGWFCYWCKKPIETLRDFTLEHLEPFNDPEVLAIACHSCNCARLPRWGLTARLERKEYLARRKEQKRAYDDQWRADNKEHVNEMQRARYYANIEKKREYFREWQKRKRQQQS